jgi:hypothetical protein
MYNHDHICPRTVPPGGYEITLSRGYVAFRHVDLHRGGIDPAEGNGLAVGEVLHGSEGDVEAAGTLVDAEDVDRPGAIGELPASAARGRVPAANGGDATDVWERGDFELRLPAIASDETVGAIRARDCGHGAAAVVVSLIVRDAVGRCGGSEGDEAKNLGELHFDRRRVCDADGVDVCGMEDGGERW